MCNAKNAFITGIKASSTALAGISWERINPAEVFSDGHWTFCQSRTISLRKRDLMAIVMGRPKNKRITTSPIIWEGDAKREDLKGFTIASKKNLYFVNLNSALIELKKSASRWTRTRRKISPFEWRKMSTFDTQGIGRFVSLNLEKSDRWEIVLTSTKRWRNYTVFTKSLEKSNSRQFLSGNTSNGIHRLLHPAHLGGRASLAQTFFGKCWGKGRHDCMKLCVVRRESGPARVPRGPASIGRSAKRWLPPITQRMREARTWQ